MHKPISDEDRLADQHEAAQSAVEQDLTSEVSLRAEREAHKDSPDLDRMAQTAKERAVAEVAGAARRAERRRGLARLVQVMDYLFGIVYVLLAVRLVLDIIGANPASGFVKLVATVTDPVFAMFQGILRSPHVPGGFTIALPILVAIGAYALLHWGARSLSRLIAYRRLDL